MRTSGRGKEEASLSGSGRALYAAGVPGAIELFLAPRIFTGRAEEENPAQAALAQTLIVIKSRARHKVPIAFQHWRRLF